MLSNRSGGSISREEARHQQLLRYEQDAKKFAEKQKIKEDKKKAEKWKKYSHIDMGERLSSGISTNSNSLNVARQQQQNRYDLEGMYGYIEELERENARLRREEEKRKEKLNKLVHVDTGKTLKSDACKTKKSSENSSSVTRGGAVRDGMSKPSCLSTSFNENGVSDLGGSQSEEPEDKEEQFRREMRRVREQMQLKYNDQVKNVTD